MSWATFGLQVVAFFSGLFGGGSSSTAPKLTPVREIHIQADAPKPTQEKIVLEKSTSSKPKKEEYAVETDQELLNRLLRDITDTNRAILERENSIGEAHLQPGVHFNIDKITEELKKPRARLRKLYELEERKDMNEIRKFYGDRSSRLLIS